jgi:hypothetical protein
MNGKVKGAIVAGLLFFIVSHPFVYRAVDSLLRDILGPIAGPGGSPTTWGLILHSIVFAALTYIGVGL